MVRSGAGTAATRGRRGRRRRRTVSARRGVGGRARWRGPGAPAARARVPTPATGTAPRTRRSSAGSGAAYPCGMGDRCEGATPRQAAWRPGFQEAIVTARMIRVARAMRLAASHAPREGRGARPPRARNPSSSDRTGSLRRAAAETRTGSRGQPDGGAFARFSARRRPSSTAPSSAALSMSARATGWRTRSRLAAFWTCRDDRDARRSRLRSTARGMARLLAMRPGPAPRCGDELQEGHSVKGIWCGRPSRTRHVADR